jgi:hypothetical protein
MVDFSSVIEITKSLYQYGVFYLVIIFLLIYFLRNPEKVEKWHSLLYRLFAWASKKNAQRYVSHDIQAEIGAMSKKINLEVEGALPYGIEIKWTNVEKVESDVKEGKIIILMKDYHNQSINLARAALVYVHEGLIPQARPYVEKTLMKSIDYITTRKLLAKNTGSVRYFNDEIIEKEKITDQNLDLWLKRIAEINNLGFLTRMVVQDLQDYLTLLYPTNPTDSVYKETINYADYVYKFVTKKPEEERVPPFSSAMFPIEIVPIAMREKVALLGFEPHLKFVEERSSKGRTRFHIIAAGKVNVALAKLFGERLLKEFSFVERKNESYEGIYRGAQTKLACITLESLS